MKEQEETLKEFVKETMDNSQNVLLRKMEAMETRIMLELKKR